MLRGHMTESTRDLIGDISADHIHRSIQALYHHCNSAVTRHFVSFSCNGSILNSR